MPICSIYSGKRDEIKSFSTDDLPSSGTISVGRSSQCDISLKNLAGVDGTVGRTHFFLVKQGKTWAALHAGSNGIYRDGRQVGEAALYPGTRIKFGSCFLVIGDKDPLSPYDLTWEDEDGALQSAPLWLGNNYVGAAGSNTIRIPTAGISRSHACIKVRKEIAIEDLKSSNGTEVGGARITAAIHLQPDQDFKLGFTPCRVGIIDAQPVRHMNAAEAQTDERRRLLIGIGICLLFMIIAVLQRLLRG